MPIEQLPEASIATDYKYRTISCAYSLRKEFTGFLFAALIV